MYTHKYKCRLYMDSETSYWTGKILEANLLGSHIEAEVIARGSSFRIILGHSQHGNFLCVPNWNIGIELADWDDYAWNYENLINAYPEINRIDAASIVSAINELAILTCS